RRSEVMTGGALATIEAEGLDTGAVLRVLENRGEGTLVVGVRAPVVPLVQALSALPGMSPILWDPALRRSPDSPESFGFAANGVAHRVDVDGGDRFALAIERAKKVFLDVETSEAMPAPRLFGGFAFDHRTPWPKFGGGSFVLPRWCYASDG